ncbi:hypothetical protein Acid7E03_00590 [Acidisoma sp. 7E03]
MQGAGIRLAQPLRFLADGGDFAEDDPRPRGDRSTGAGEHDGFRRPFHEIHTQFFLELADLGGKRGLRDETSLGRPPEIAVLGKGEKILKFAEVHGHPGRAAAHGRRPPIQAAFAACRAWASFSVAGAEWRIR